MEGSEKGNDIKAFRGILFQQFLCTVQRGKR